MDEDAPSEQPRLLSARSWLMLVLLAVLLSNLALRSSPAATGPDRLAPAPRLPTATDTYRFLRDHPDGSGPVAWDPCRPIRFVTNSRTAFDDGEVVSEAIEIVSAASGLVFVDDGETSEPPAQEGFTRNEQQPERYGAWPAPVLIAWSDAEESAELEGDTVAYAYAVDTYGAPGRDVYVSGEVVLDGPELARIHAAWGPTWVRRTIVHELGHLVGLDHVEDESEIMVPGGAATTLGPGDLRGLALLGRGDCFPDL